MTMQITIYSKNNCVYCTIAKNLVKNLSLDYTEKSLEKDFVSDPSKMLEDIGKNVRQMPQIKIDNELIGGYNQLVEYFEKQGKVNFKVRLSKYNTDDKIIQFPTDRIVKKEKTNLTLKEKKMVKKLLNKYNNNKQNNLLKLL